MQSSYRAEIAQAVAYIEQDICADLRAARLAQRCGLSPFHFQRLFLAIVGESPKRYVQRLRLERSAHHLKQTSRSIVDVALESGYANHESFTRAFKARFGIAPRDFRRSVAAPCSHTRSRLAIVALQPRSAAFIRHVGPYGEASRAFRTLTTWARARGLLGGAWIGVYWDDQSITAPERTRCDVGLTVQNDTKGEGRIAVRRLPGGEHAVFRDDAPPEQRRRTYELAYAEWLPALGREPADAPPFELYPAASCIGTCTRASTWIHVPLRPR